MTIISGYTTLLAIQATFFVGQSSARPQRGHLFGSSKRVGWEIKSHAGVPLTTSSQTLESFLMQVRGGSSYDDDDRRKPQQGGYYDDDGYGKGFDSRDWEGDGYQDDRDYNRDDGYSGNNRNSYDDYDDRGSSSRPGSSNAVQSSLSSVGRKFKNGDRRIGVPLLGLGVVFTMLGVSLFFNKALMRLGNLLFIAGVPTTLGPSRTAGYFFKPEKTRATACLFLGILLVFVGWPMVGMALEVFGILNLFGNMFPIFWAVVKNMPIVSSLTKNSGSGRRQTYSYERERDQDYRDDPYADDRQGYSNYRDDDAEKYY